MTLKIDSPLFATVAHGQIAVVGCFRTFTNGNTTLSDARPGTPNPVPNHPEYRDNFRIAQQNWIAIEPDYQNGPPRYNWIRSTSWPTFWTQWRIDNPTGPVIATSAATLDNITLLATGTIT